MTQHTAAPESYEQVAARLRPIFQRIAAGAAARERERRLPYEEVAWLREAGFGALRVPVEHGGAGLGLRELFGLLVELGTADSNLPQLLRAHVLFTEGQLHDPDSPTRTEWLDRLVAGDLVGNAVSERGEHAVGRLDTTLSQHDGKWSLRGTKYYATGSLFADWITVRAERGPGDLVLAHVPATASGVVQHDDWDGFGQRVTGSGTVELHDVEVAPEHIAPFVRTTTVHTALAQLVLLASLTGVARAAARDATEFVQDRRRTYSHASADLPRHDPLVQQVIGRLHSAAFAAESIVDSAVAQVVEAQRSGSAEAIDHAEIRTSQAQVVVLDLVLSAVSTSFDVGGASLVDAERALDRHWRNARTLASHNPVVYKSRDVGAHALNGVTPVYNWVNGTAAAGTATTG